MRLIRLQLQNFRQHADTELTFRSGLTGIIGPNGAGKTTVLEAIAWAIYGASAVRGTNETLRFNRAPGRSTVRAELEFALDGDRYRVVRTPRGAELYQEDREDPIAAGVSEVTRQLTRLLGMTRQEFFNTYFTGQKELQFLATMGAAERARFLSQVLGYEKLRAAQNLVREQRKILKGQVEELSRALGDPEEIRRATAEATTRLRAATVALREAEQRQSESAKRLAGLEPAWNELRNARERDRQLREELRVQEVRLERVVKERQESEKELASLAEVARLLDDLKAEARPLDGLRAEAEELRVLEDAESRRTALKKQLEDQRVRVEKLAAKVRDQEEKGKVRAELSDKLAKQQKECERLESARESATSRWQRDIQDVEARLRILLNEADELKRRIGQLEAEGPEGACPTCERPLGAEYERVLGQVRGRWEEVVQDGKWHRKRQSQLNEEPADVAAAKAELAEARAEKERLAAALSAAEAAHSQAGALKGELEVEEAEARSMAGELAALPEGYDRERSAKVKEELERLKQLEKRITQLETRLERESSLKARRAETLEEERQIRADVERLRSSQAILGFSEDDYRAAGEEYESARAGLEAAGLELERTRGEMETARQAVEATRHEESEYQRISRQIADRQSEHRLHNDLDGALGELRDVLNDRVRPELSEIASVLLTELTDGRYNQIEIDRDYRVVVLDEGEEKPVISGGEEDLANLVLRLAISQMIADRAGHTLSLLIFDEVFGGLDEQRRESVVRLLQRLQDRFEQVVLITHVESIREGLDHVNRVTYDERTGTSTVRDESPGAGPDNLVEDLAVLVGE